MSHRSNDISLTDNGASPFKCVTFSEQGLLFDESTTFDEWQDIGEFLGRAEKGIQWQIGDWLRFGGHRWGDKYEAAAEALGLKPKTLRDYKCVCESYPELSMRIDNCAFAHHQVAASLPEEERSEVLSLAAGFGWSASRLRTEIVQRKPRAVIPLGEAQHTVGELDELSGKKFGTIYADPPWQYGNQSTRAATDNHYSTMSVDALCEMPVEDYAADDAHLHLWTTNAFLRDAFRVIDAWGFEYRSCFVWVKPQMGIGNYWRVSHEFMLLGIRGNAKRFNVRNEMSWGKFDRTKHSKKPHEVRAAIERVSTGPYLELFGREPVSGWTVLGNQIAENKLFA